MQPQNVRLFVPFAEGTPWIVRREAERVGTYASQAEAVLAARLVRAKLIRAWQLPIPPVRVQSCDGSWRDVEEDRPTSCFG